MLSQVPGGPWRLLSSLLAGVALTCAEQERLEVFKALTELGLLRLLCILGSQPGLLEVFPK